MSNVIVAQSGGPTVAINASLVGVLAGARKCSEYDKVYGSVHGIEGVFEENFLDLTDVYTENSPEENMIFSTPSSYLGSCRYKLPHFNDDPETYKKLFNIFDKYDVGAFFYIGGNDSMDTIMKLAEYGKQIGSTIRFGGVPKTVDNDLMDTDHTPGFGSAAKFIATTMLEIAHDTSVYQADTVTIVEIMGRDAGWLTASAALARNSYSSLPQLIYLPEVAFDKDEFIGSIKEILKKTNNILVAISEGIHDADGNYLSASSKAEDKFGHAQLSGTGKVLESLVKAELGIKCRSIELSLPQRCAAHISSLTDLREAAELGEKAVEFAAQGNTGYMSSIIRKPGADYSCEIGMADLTKVANQEKKIPREWINEAGNDVTSELIDYLKPLIQGETNVKWENGLPVYKEIKHLTES
ncbi:MAG: 6-phosphofructokinase [Eubacterium sp.]|nr:6-phosphofructokinase [Eubacterium sp.]